MNRDREIGKRVDWLIGCAVGVCVGIVLLLIAEPENGIFDAFVFGLGIVVSIGCAFGAWRQCEWIMNVSVPKEKRYGQG